MGSRNSTCLPKISPFPAFPQGFWRRIVPLTERSIKRLPVKEVNRWKQFNNRRWAKDWIVAFGRGECCRHNFGSHLQPYFRSQMHVLLNRWDRWDRPEYRKYRLRDLCSVRSQVALQYEFDIREIGNNFSTGYIPFGATEPLANPVFIYGTEVFKINDTLRHR